MGEVYRLLNESWESLMDGGIYAERYVTPDGMVYWVRKSDDFRVNINLMDEVGDTVQEVLQSGKKVDDVGGLAGDAIKGGSGAKIGDFTNLEGSTVDDILDRIPDEATLCELHPCTGRCDGFGFKMDKPIE